MENFDCCKFGKTEPEEHSSDAVRYVINDLLDELDAINNLSKKNRKFPSGGVVNESAQGEYIVQRPNKARKKYVVKKQFEKAASKILGIGSLAIPFEVWVPSIAEKALKEYGVFDLFCEEAEAKWRDPVFHITVVESMSTMKKAKLLIRMQSWADFHNKADQFVADWANDEQVKFGLCIYRGRGCGLSNAKDENGFLFQIWVGSYNRSKQMLDYFREEIEELLHLKMI